MTCHNLASPAGSHGNLQCGQVPALRDGQSELMESYVKEESKGDLEMDPEM